MNAFVGYCYQIAGPMLERRKVEMDDLQHRLMKAHIGIRAAAFASAVLVVAVATFLWVGLVLGAVLLLADVSLGLVIVAPLLLSVFLAVSVVGIAFLSLDIAASDKAKDIDENLPQALNYMLALANAGLPPKAIWASLAQQPVFGVIHFEAERIHRDLDLFGKDLIMALRTAQERTPSKRLAEFLQGAISAFRSGVELGTYLKSKSRQYQFEEEQVQKENVDTIGVMAESFLVVVVAAPLFLIILLTVMAINNGEAVIFYGLVLVLGYIPMAQFGIGAIIRSMNPRIWT